MAGVLAAYIIADDLTGACDAGVAFAHVGLPSYVHLSGTTPCAKVLIRSTDSREDPPEVAARKVAAHFRPARLVYKKIDSVLRGNVSAEVRAALTVSGLGSAVICPAFPAQGRTVRQGVSSPAHVRLRDLFPEDCFDIPDATTDEDLRQIARDVVNREPVPLAVGSAGLARELALLLPGGRPVPSVSASADHEGLALLLIGSDHAVTAAQLEYLAARGGNAASHELYRVFPDLPSSLIARAESLRRGGLFLCGGDTAAAVCRLLGAEAIHLLREVQPGIPLGRIRGGAAHGLAVITKSGGFGQPDAMAGIVGVLSAQERES